MLRKHFILACRSLVRNKVYSLINIFGLSIALTAFILIMLYVRFEFSYDQFHKSAQNIYRINTAVSLSGERINHESSTYQGIVDALKNDFPEVIYLTVVSTFDSDGTLLRIADDRIQKSSVATFKGCYADAAFFKVFSFPLTKGDAGHVLKEPFSAVISESMARKHFHSDPIGKTLELTNDDSGPRRLTITGVLRDVPVNSHLQFDFVVNIPEAPGKFWEWTGHPYMLLHANSNVSQIEYRLSELPAKNVNIKTNADDYGQISSFKLQPLEEIHLFSNLDFEFEPGGYGQFVYSLIALACILVIIAWVNYINLSTAMSIQKVRQIGVRKIVGASKWALASQVLTESALCNAISIVLAVLLVRILQPMFNQLLNTPSTAISFSDPYLWIAAMAFLILSTVASGGYLATVIASMPPLTAMKGQEKTKDAFTLRKALVVFQFTAAISLMITSAVAFKQLRFMQNLSLGINIDQVLVVKALNFDKEAWSDAAEGYVVDSAWQKHAALFQEELAQQSAIDNTTALSHLPGQAPNWGTEFKAESIDPLKAYSLKAIGVGYNFISTLQAKLLAGRNFSREFPSDQGNEKSRAVLINDATRKLLGFRTPDDALSKHITSYWGSDYKIIGVVNSFHHLSAKENVAPLYFILQPRALSYFAVRLKATDISTAIDRVEEAWHRHFPDLPFNYFFLDEFFNKQYQNERRFSDSIGILTALSLFIGCLGLFGLTAFTAMQRTKEIAIRKVLGATITDVMALFSSEFIRLYAIASSIATPLAYFAATRWLNNYAYKISLLWWMFALPVATIALLALSTVCMQVIGVAKRNPLENLNRD
jgi:putative ABC transport system permease protein